MIILSGKNNCMLINKNKIEEYNQPLIKEHQRKFEFMSSDIKNAGEIINKLIQFQIAIPSWALGSGGTRFAVLVLAVSHVISKKK